MSCSSVSIVNFELVNDGWKTSFCLLRFEAVTQSCLGKVIPRDSWGNMWGGIFYQWKCRHTVCTFTAKRAQSQLYFWEICEVFQTTYSPVISWSSRPEMVFKKVVLKNFRLRPATLLKKRPWHRCFPVNFAKFLRTPFYITPLVAASVMPSLSMPLFMSLLYFCLECLSWRVQTCFTLGFWFI